MTRNTDAAGDKAAAPGVLDPRKTKVCWTFTDGMRVALSTPGFILLASSAGFGALAKDAGMSLFNAVLMMGTFFALPAQVVLMDQLARGGSLFGGAVAVSLTGVRLVPMVVSILPWWSDDRPAVWRRLWATHTVAITAWLEGHRILPRVPEGRRMTVFLGIGTAMVLTTLMGTALGFELAGSVSPAIAAMLLFLTPIYFLLSLMASASRSMDWMAIVVGSIMGPTLYLFAPGFDLLLTGLIGGTAAYLAGNRVDNVLGDPEADE